MSDDIIRELDDVLEEIFGSQERIEEVPTLDDIPSEEIDHILK